MGNPFSPYSGVLYRVFGTVPGLCYLGSVLTLGIETSCDETSCGIVDDGMRVLANQVYSQIPIHSEYGGVVPEIAARAHLEKIDSIVRLALDEAGLDIRSIDRIAFTRGPGLLGPLLVGASFARALGRSLGKPVTGVNHLEGHLASAFLEDPALEPPFLCLVVSGGHTEFVQVEPGLVYTMVGKTRDDAAGEAFDKCGKILGLGYPAGPILARTAVGGKRDFVPFPKALDQRDNFEFSFSGLKSAMLRYAESKDPEYLRNNLSHICASLESAIVDLLVKKSINALFATKMQTIAVVGGVSANEYLRARMETETKKRGFRALFPARRYCGDNGAMIAAIGQWRANHNLVQTEVGVTPSLRWL
ncbi:MAG: metalloendopeptidase glycoprotease family [Fibrobacteres bacterium]|nr:metalloendopeptidase glycoprotease family [Fibrobacterota bacterium]